MRVVGREVQRFIDDRINTSDGSDQDSAVMFFDESIIAKLNRSAFTKNRPTPFIDDRSYGVAKTIISHEADTRGLGPDMFVYDSFPRLNHRWFPQEKREVEVLDPEVLRSQQSVSKHKKNASLGGGELPAVQYPAEAAVYAIWFKLLAASLPKHIQPQDLTPFYDVYLRIKAEHVSIDEAVYRALLDCCGKAGCPDLAFHVIQDMQADGYTPDAATYSAILSALDANSRNRTGSMASAFGRAPNNPAAAAGTPERSSRPPTSSPLPAAPAPSAGMADASAAGGAPRGSGHGHSLSVFIPSAASAAASVLSPAPANSSSFFAVYVSPAHVAPRKSLGMTKEQQSEYYMSLFEFAFPGLTIRVADTYAI
jgi:pentatricopeptide repeat protein